MGIGKRCFSGPGSPVPGRPIPGNTVPVPVPVGPPPNVELSETRKGAEVNDAEGKGAVPIGGMAGGVIVMVKEID